MWKKRRKKTLRTHVCAWRVCMCVCVCVSQLIVWSMKAFACFAENSIPLEIIDTSSHEFNLCGKIAYALVSCVVFCSSGIYILLDHSQVSQTRNNDSQMKKRVLCSTRKKEIKYSIFKYACSVAQKSNSYGYGSSSTTSIIINKCICFECSMNYITTNSLCKIKIQTDTTQKKISHYLRLSHSQHTNRWMWMVCFFLCIYPHI